MKFISHRGNLTGKKPEIENSPHYIDAALLWGFDVEIDVWFKDGEFWLGHDEPGFQMPERYFDNDRIWLHLKNIEAHTEMQRTFRTAHTKYFWHQEDDYSIVSNGKVWTYPGKKLYPGFIAVLPEQAYDGNLSECYAICSDNIMEYRHTYESIDNS